MRNSNLNLGRLGRDITRVATTRGLNVLLAMALSIVVANRFGAGTMTDAFFLARRLCFDTGEMLRALVVTSLVPSLVIHASRSGPQATRRLLVKCSFAMVGVGLIVAFGGVVYAGDVVALIAPGFGPEQAGVATHLLKIFVFVFPTTLFISVITSGLHADRRFGLAETVVLLPKALAVGAALYFVPPAGIEILVWCFVFGMLLAAIVLLVFAALGRRGWEPGSTDRDETRNPAAYGRFGAVFVFHASGQAAAWMDLYFLSSLAIGAVSVLEYAQRLISIVPAIIAAAIVIPLYTEFSRTDADLPELVARGQRAGLFLMIPLVAMLIPFSGTIVDFLLYHGNFTAEAAMQTKQLMPFYGVAVILYFLTSIVAHARLADASSNTVSHFVVVAGVGLVVRFFVLTASVKLWGIFGLPVAAIANAILNVALFSAPRAYRQAADRRHWKRVLAISLLGVGVLLFLSLADHFFDPGTGSSTLLRLLWIGALSLAAAGLYLYLARLFRFAELDLLVQAVRGGPLGAIGLSRRRVVLEDD